MKMRQNTKNQTATRFLLWFDEKNRARKSTSGRTQIDFRSRANQLPVRSNTINFSRQITANQPTTRILMWFDEKNQAHKIDLQIESTFRHACKVRTIFFVKTQDPDPGPNFLSQLKSLIAFSALSKPFVPAQKPKSSICLTQTICDWQNKFWDL